MTQHLSFLEKVKIGEFDILCSIALCLRKPSLSDLEGSYETDLFRSSSPEVQEAALQLYPVLHEFHASEFKKFLEEASELKFDETLLTLKNETKIKWIDIFTDHHCTKSIIAILTDDTFNPLYATDYCNGLAVRFVQNPVSFLEDFRSSILRVFAQMDLTKEKFLRMTFEQQLMICFKCSPYLIAEWQAMGEAFPKDLSSE